MRRGVEVVPLFDRLLSKIQQTSTGCWLFTGRLTPSGYATLKQRVPRTKNWRAHRLSYELFIGPIPDGLEPDHVCRVTSCINPTHLELVTGRVNVLRGTAPSAVNAAKTACIHGHPFDAANTTNRSDGSRRCRACHRSSEYRRKHPHTAQEHSYGA